MVASSRLSLCMIVRDSSRTLPACLATISPWVDEMIVVDTGSTDGTKNIASAQGALVHEFPWCDSFAAARNESLRHATGGWLFWMDSDDTISRENGQKLRDLVRLSTASTTAYVMQVHCPGPPGTTDVTIVDHVKLFRNDPRLRFEGRIHEQILPAIRRINGRVDWTDIFVTHSGSEHSVDARKRKQQRDLRLLEMELAEQPEHPFVLFNLGMTYADMEEHDSAAGYLKRCLLVSSPDESHVRKAYALLVGCLLRLDRDEEARRVLGRGRELFTEDAELLFRQGILEQKIKNYDDAIVAYIGALEDRGERHFNSRDQGIAGYKARHNLAGIYREMGRLDLAEFQWRLAVAEQPAYREGWRGLVESLLGQEKLTTLEVEIESAGERDLPPEELACAAARLAIHRGKLDEALEVLDRAIKTLDAIEPLQLKCQLLFENALHGEAVAALEELCRRAPEDGAAWHNLGTAYQQSGCLALAVNSYQRSIVVRPHSVPTLLQLGYAQQALDRPAAAQGAWEKALKLAPEDLAVRQAIGSVKEIAAAG